MHKNVLERISTGDNKHAHRDSFEFPDNYRLEFSSGPSGRVSLMAFAIPQEYIATAGDKSQSVVSETDVRRAVMRVEATLGRDRRFQRKTTETE